MRVITGKMSATYSGRVEAELSVGDAALMIRDGVNGDRSVMIVSASEGVQPKNWMPAGSEIKETEGGFLITRKTERLEVFFHETYFDERIPDTHSPKLEKVGSEHQFRDLLSENLDRLAAHLNFQGRTLDLVQCEYRTSAGPIDILARAGDELFVVELKRRKCSVQDLYQVRRYIEHLEKDGTSEGLPVHGVLVGPSATRGLFAQVDSGLETVFIRMSFGQLQVSLGEAVI